jgi:hypothetical protein
MKMLLSEEIIPDAEDAKVTQMTQKKTKIENQKKIENRGQNLILVFFFCLLLRPLRVFASSASGQVRFRPLSSFNFE